jgi:hypothetical protein
MSRRLAKVTQADVARAIRAAKQAGATDITIRPDGSIVIGLSLTQIQAGAEPELAPELDIVL